MAHTPDRFLRTASRWPLAVSILATVGILMTAAMVIFDLRREVSGRACENADNLLHVMAEDVARNVEILDLSLQAVVDGLGRPDVMAAEPGLRRMILFDRSATATGLGAQVVFDERGILTLDSLDVVPRVIAPVIDRDYFNAQREADIGLFISQPYRSRLIGEDVIGLSRRISHPDGSFGGVALATIQLRYFDELLSSLKLGPGAVVSLVRLDGAMLVRHGPSGLAMPANVAGSPAFQHMRTVGSGTITATSRLDGIERQYNFRRVGRLPLILSVGLSTETLYAAWTREAVAVAATLAVICLAMIGLTVRLTKELGRRAVAERALVEVNAELSRLSSTDALTELGNRRAFDESLARETRRAARIGQTLSLIVLDVDHFKMFNDTYGHQEGDATLRALAGILGTSGRRASDQAFRVGGEEFAIILPDTDLAGAAAQAELVRQRVRERSIPHAKTAARIVTVSLGVTEAGPDGPAAAFARADAALYASKRQGRDGVVALKPAVAA